MIFPRQRAARAVVMAVVLTCLGACNASTVDQANPTFPPSASAQITSPDPAETPQVISSYVASCADGRREDSQTTSADDLVLGTVRFAGALLYATTPGGAQPDGSYFFKAGAEITKGSSPVTLWIAPEMTGKAAFVFERADGYPQQVTIESCPTYDIWFVGGVTLLKQPSACVPVDVQVLGKPKQRVMVSLAAGPC